MTTLVMSISPAQLADRAVESLPLTSVYGQYYASGVQFDALRSRIAELVARIDSQEEEATTITDGPDNGSVLHEQAIAELVKQGAITEHDARRLAGAARLAGDQCRIS